MSSYSLIAFEEYRKADKFYSNFYQASLTRAGKHFMTTFDLAANPPKETVWVKNGDNFSKLILKPYTTYVGDFQSVSNPIILDEDGTCIYGL